MASSMQDVAIVGVAESDIGVVPDKSKFQLSAEASRLALEDAGLSIKDVDGIFTNIITEGGQFSSMMMAEYMGITPRYTDSTSIGGSSFVVYVEHAAMAIAAGMCEVALICHGSTNISDRGGKGGPVSQATDVFGPTQFEEPYGISTVGAYALAAQRHMHEYGTTSEQLAEIAVATRKWACLNPKARMQDPITIDDVMNSRVIASPLHLLDCCLVSDGGAAMILVKSDRAKDFPKPPIYMLGVGSRTDHNIISAMPDLTVTSAKEAAAAAFTMAGVTPDEIDVVEIYDAFTINTILFLEDMGFCPKGEGGNFVSNGNIAPGGSLPVNTNGGGLSCVHPGMYGMFLMIEAVQQLRGECGDRQVADAKLAACNGNGGFLASQVTAVFGTEETL